MSYVRKNINAYSVSEETSIHLILIKIIKNSTYFSVIKLKYFVYIINLLEKKHFVNKCIRIIQNCNTKNNETHF